MIYCYGVNGYNTHLEFLVCMQNYQMFGLSNTFLFLQMFQTTLNYNVIPHKYLMLFILYLIGDP